MDKRLLQLLYDNRSVSGRVHGLAGDVVAGEATVYLYDTIVGTQAEAEWWGGVPADEMVQTLRALEADTIRLRINSPGGDVFAARAIEAAIRDSKARTIAHIDGVAASAASFLAIAADEVEIAPGGMIMVHKGWTLALGNADDMRATAELLDKVDGTLIDSYARKTGASREVIDGWLARDTWFTAQEALDAKLADRIAEAAVKAQSPAWNLAALKALHDDRVEAAAQLDAIARERAEERRALSRREVLSRARALGIDV